MGLWPAPGWSRLTLPLSREDHAGGLAGSGKPRVGFGEVRAVKLVRHRPDTEDAQLIASLRGEADVRDEEIAALHRRLDAAELELEDLRAIRDALTPPELPQRPGLELAAAFIPAAEHVSGDFYLVAEGPQDSTLLVIGDVVGHGLQAGRRAAFVRTAFAATAPFSDDPCRQLNWANSALIERAGTSSEFVTAACVTYLPSEQLLRWAYAGHPPALRMRDGRELAAPAQGIPLGLGDDPGYVEGSLRSESLTGLLLYTDGLTEARRGGKLLRGGGGERRARRARQPFAERGPRFPAQPRRRVRRGQADRRSVHARRSRPVGRAINEGSGGR